MIASVSYFRLSNLWITDVDPFSRFLGDEKKLSALAALLQICFIIDHWDVCLNS